MLRTLLESRSRKAGNPLGTAASAGIHVTLIVLAAFATAAGAPPEADRESPTDVTWVTPKRGPDAQARAARRVAGRRTVSEINAPSLSSLAINTSIPDVDISLGLVRADDFVSTAVPGDGATTDSRTTPGIDNPAYDSYEVDKAVTAISGVAPAYPAAMRTAGIEGDVKAEFVVNENGRAVRSTLRIVSSSNEQFSEAVRRSLPNMRFAPAQLRGRPVAQTVQQLFAFRLNR